MQQLEKRPVGEMLGKEDCPFATADRRRHSAAFRVRTAYPRDTLEIVPAATKPLADLLDALKTVPAI